MDSPRLDRPHRGIAAREVLEARARAWAYVFQCWQGKQSAADMTSTNGPSVRHMEGVGDVGQDPIDDQELLSPIHES